MNLPLRSSWIFVAGALVVGVVVGRIWTSEDRAAAQATGTTVHFPMVMRTGCNLYLQTSAEFQAACLQTYQCAAARLAELVPTVELNERPPAVVMDLDETVFDNSAFQTYLYRTGQEYDPHLWNDYEQNFSADVTLIPGAKRFIEFATERGAAVIFLSNRLDKFKASTIAALNRLGLAGENVEARLFLKTDETSSDKTIRRAQVAEKYDVVMLVGDNLRDFSEEFVAPKITPPAQTNDVLAAIAARKSAVGRTADRWGRDWFILPNPVYGEWDKLIQVPPLELMHPTTMPSGN